MRRTKMRGAGLSALCALLAAALAGAAARPQEPEPSVVVAPAPDWVKPAVMPEARDERLGEVADGVYYLIFDRQVRYDGVTDVTFGRTASLVVERSGLESAGRLEFSFDPSEEEFRVHAVRVIRDGVALDRLPGLAFTLARREEGLDAGVLDGDLTAYVEVPDVRVGDIVDYEVSWVTRSALWPGGLARSTSLQWGVPVEFFRHRVLTPADMPLTIASNRDDSAPQIRDLGDLREYEWSGVDIPPSSAESYTPGYYADWGYAAYSTMSSWAQVADWAVDVFDVDSELSPSLQSLVEQIRRDEPDEAGRITAAVRHVQENVRYVANEVGLGSHVPRPPAEVARLGYGDCKDKALLLAVMLNALGVEAAPALTHASIGRRLPNWAPSPWAFDHAITVVEAGGERHWIDPTDSHQGGRFPHIAWPDYGYGLVVRDGETGLSPIETRAPGDSHLTIEETFVLPGNEAGPVSLEVATTYAGREADAFRRRLAASSIRGFSEDYLNYYGGLYPGIEALAPLDVEDDVDANTIVARESYVLSHESFLADGLINAFPLRADAVLGSIEEITQAGPRTAPVGLGLPRKRRHVIRLTQAGQPLRANAPVDVDNDYFVYSSRETSGDGWLTIDADFEIRARELPPEEFRVYTDMYETLDHNGYLEIDLEIPAPAEGFWANLTAEEQETYLGGGVVVALIMAMLVGAVVSLRADAKFEGASVFHPVSPTKFVVLSLATFGLYSMLWFWKNWRWSKEDDPRPLSPFGRSLFSIFFYYPMYAVIREKATRGRIPAFLAGLLALAYFAWVMTGRIGDRLTDQHVYLFIQLSAFIWVLPLVLMVNAQNREHADALAYNSRFTAWTIAAVLIGGAFWLLVLYGMAVDLWPATFDPAGVAS